MAERVKVILRTIQILDDLEPFFKDRGEFRFTSRVTGDAGTAQETQFPTEGHYELSDHPAWNRLNLDRVIFEGDVANELTVELEGEELDSLSANDLLARYSRTFTGTPSSWFGRYGPWHDEPPPADHPQPESMNSWRVSYTIERG